MVPAPFPALLALRPLSKLTKTAAAAALIVTPRPGWPDPREEEPEEEDSWKLERRCRRMQRPMPLGALALGCLNSGERCASLASNLRCVRGGSCSSPMWHQIRNRRNWLALLLLAPPRPRSCQCHPPQAGCPALARRPRMRMQGAQLRWGVLASGAQMLRLALLGCRVGRRKQ